MRLAAAIGMIAGLALAAPVLACEPAPGYRVPTNLELVALADVIAIAHVRSGPDVSAIRPGIATFPTTKFDLLRLLKGKTQAMRVEAEETFLMKSPAGLSHPRELRFAHPDGYAGPCTRHVFVAGSTVLLFLVRDNSGNLNIMDLPFARVSEDVRGDGSLWERAVREYIAIATLPKTRWDAALLERRQSLGRNPGDRDAVAIATDMARRPGEDEDSPERAKLFNAQFEPYWKALRAEVRGPIYAIP